MKQLSMGVLAVAVVAVIGLVGCVSVVEAAQTKGRSRTGSEKQRLKQVAASFKRLQQTRSPSPALLAEARKHAAWLKDHARKHPARYHAAFKRVMAGGSITPAQKREFTKMAQAKGGYSGVVVNLADRLHRTINPNGSSAGRVRPSTVHPDGFDFFKLIPPIIDVISEVAKKL